MPGVRSCAVAQVEPGATESPAVAERSKVPSEPVALATLTRYVTGLDDVLSSASVDAAPTASPALCAAHVVAAQDVTAARSGAHATDPVGVARTVTRFIAGTTTA